MYANRCCLGCLLRLRGGGAHVFHHFCSLCARFVCFPPRAQTSTPRPHRMVDCGLRCRVVAAKRWHGSNVLVRVLGPRGGQKRQPHLYRCVEPSSASASLTGCITPTMVSIVRWYSIWFVAETPGDGCYLGCARCCVLPNPFLVARAYCRLRLPREIW